MGYQIWVSVIPLSFFPSFFHVLTCQCADDVHFPLFFSLKLLHLHFTRTHIYHPLFTRLTQPSYCRIGISRYDATSVGRSARSIVADADRS